MRGETVEGRERRLILRNVSHIQSTGGGVGWGGREREVAIMRTTRGMKIKEEDGTGRMHLHDNIKEPFEGKG